MLRSKKINVGFLRVSFSYSLILCPLDVKCKGMHSEERKHTSLDESKENGKVDQMVWKTNKHTQEIVLIFRHM